MFKMYELVMWENISFGYLSAVYKGGSTGLSLSDAVDMFFYDFDLSESVITKEHICGSFERRISVMDSMDENKLI